MERDYYVQLASDGLRLPMAANLVLHEYADPQAILRNGNQLGMVLEQTAHRYRSPLALPHMNLELEKTAFLCMLGIPAEARHAFHFDACPGYEELTTLHQHLRDPLPPELQAHVDSVGYIARHTRLLPVGMVIGPFSFMTKLVADPITPIALAGSGVTAEEDEEIRTVETVLELGMRVILHSIAAQVRAGAKAVFIAEPAANNVYLSPNQVAGGAEIVDRYVMGYLRQIKAFLDEHGVDLFFHCCGELTEYLLRQFCTLDPAILSLGSSRVLWEDAVIVPKSTVLFGNLPSRQFFSDNVISTAEVAYRAERLVRKMREVHHPFILSTECDVLSVPGCEQAIERKITAMMKAGKPEMAVICN